jgi:hypothetical protein
MHLSRGDGYNGVNSRSIGNVQASLDAVGRCYVVSQTSGDWLFFVSPLAGAGSYPAESCAVA